MQVNVFTSLVSNKIYFDINAENYATEVSLSLPVAEQFLKDLTANIKAQKEKDNGN